MPIIRRTLTSLALPLAAAWLLIITAAAASAPHFTALQVSLWPEYDRPSVLVMYDITLPAEASLPVALEIPIPARAGEPNAVAYEQPGGNLVNAEYTYSSDGEWGIVHVNAMMPNLHIEYYDPALQKDGDRRTFTFAWPGGFQVDAVKLVVQQPATASEMEISPQMGNGAVESDGLTYYRAQLGALQSDQTFQVSIAYTKSDDTLSAETLKPHDGLVAPPIQPVSTWQKVLPWALILLGVAFVAIGVRWYWMNTHRRATAPARPHRRRPLPPEALAADLDTTEVRYCPQCGTRAQPGDRFCRACGTRLR